MNLAAAAATNVEQTGFWKLTDEMIGTAILGVAVLAIGAFLCFVVWERAVGRMDRSRKIEASAYDRKFGPGF